MVHSHAFLEGDLRFEFDPAHWQVRKYDAHPFFHGFSGVGLKGVDFVANYQGCELWLIEVKNYSTHTSKLRRREVDQALQHPQLIIEALEEKYIDTMAGIQAIDTYYRRKGRRPWNWLLNKIQADPEQAFWQEAYRLALVEKRVRPVLWLAADPSDQARIRHIAEGISRPSEFHDQRVEVFIQGVSGPPPQLEITWQKA